MSGLRRHHSWSTSTSGCASTSPTSGASRSATRVTCVGFTEGTESDTYLIPVRGHRKKVFQKVNRLKSFLQLQISVDPSTPFGDPITWLVFHSVTARSRSSFCTVVGWSRQYSRKVFEKGDLFCDPVGIRIRKIVKRDTGMGRLGCECARWAQKSIYPLQKHLLL